jgi:addiction module HigA family antidote
VIRVPKNRPPTHPGEILRLDFLRPRGISQTALAKRLKVPIQRVNQICRGRRAVTPDTALRLARVFGTSPEFWLNGQMIWDLWHALHAEGAEEIQNLQPVGNAD